MDILLNDMASSNIIGHFQVSEISLLVKTYIESKKILNFSKKI